MIGMEQGEIVLVRYPFTDPHDYKVRPAIIVSNNSFNKKFHPLACPITSKHFDKCIQINNNLSEGNLDKKSFVKTNVIVAIHPELILKIIGKSNKKTIVEIKEKITENF